MSAAAQATWRLSYEIAPIVLVNGVAQNLPGNAIPIIYFTEPRAYINGISGGPTDFGIINTAGRDLDNMFAHFYPLSGATLLDVQIGTYPFANQAVAANATINQPLHFSMMMVCPVRGTFTDYSAKAALMASLQSTLNQHSLRGGTYNVVTPSYLYQDCILVNFSDVTGGESKQKQIEWRLDFVQPLLTTKAAADAQSTMMQKITNGTPVVGNPPPWSGDVVLSTPAGQASPLVVPSARPLVAASTFPFSGAAATSNAFASSVQGLAGQALLVLGTTPTTQALQALVLGRVTNQLATAATSLFPGTSAVTTSLLSTAAFGAVQRLSSGASGGNAQVLAQTALAASSALLRSSQATARLASTTNASAAAQTATAATATSAEQLTASLSTVLSTLKAPS